MLKFARHLVLGLLLGAAIAPEALAQRHPMPRAKTEPLVLCTACPGTNALGQNNDGLPTYPYSGGLVKFTGRYLDSSSTPSTRSGFRTARARFIETATDRRGNAPPRVYIQIGNGVGAYSLDTFFTSRLQAGMIPISDIFRAATYDAGWGRNPVEQFLLWDSYVYAEADTMWQTPGGDFQDYMGLSRPIDFDDRGYVYLASNRYGWGIVTDAGDTAGAQMKKVVQLLPAPDSRSKLDNSGVSAHAIIAVKVGTKYYAIVGDDSAHAVWDVTTPTDPKLVSTVKGTKYGILRADRSESGTRVAIAHADGVLRVYDSADLVAGGAPLAQESGTRGFAEVSFDESGNVWAVENKFEIWRLTPSGNGYRSQSFSALGDFSALLFHARAGYIAVGGIDWSAPGFPYDVKLFRMESTGPKPVDIDGFFRKYYHAAPAGYAQPGTYTAIQSQSADLQIIKWGGKTYLLYSGFGIGDVFELEASNAINIAVKSNFGTVNPKAQSTQPGPYYGDIVNFVATSSSANANYDVNWIFGNPEVGTTNNSGRSRTGEDEPHQYGGLTTVAAITSTKVVQAQTVQDPNIQAQHNLLLKVPTPRVGATTLSTPLAASTTGLDFVAGERFHDASDGVVEGHYGVWTIDGVTEKLNPLGTVAVGTIGAHTLQFQAVYGPYDTTFNNTTGFSPAPITVGYTVKPFKIALDTPVSAGTNVTFAATARVTQESGIITPGSQWTVNWTLNGAPYPAAAAGGVGANAAQLAPVGTIPPVSIPTALLTDGSTVGLSVTIDSASLSEPARPFNAATASMTLSTPDPLIEVTGCQNAGSPCKFTAKSVGGKSQTGWAYLWTLNRPGGLTPLTHTGATFEPTLSVSGNYTITLKTTKTIFEATVDKQLTVAGSLCGALPQTHTIGLNASCLSNCPAGTAIDFSPTFQGYSRQTCDQYLWSFGDGSTANTEVASHAYASQGTYTVTLTISNSAPSTVVKTRQITVGGGGGGNENPTCTKPTAASMTYSGTPSGCSATGGSCRTTDNITFTARRGTQSLQTCDSVRWEFPDGTTSTQQQVTKSFATAGTHAVKLTVTNSNGSAEVTQNVTIVNPPTGSCNTPPQPANFVITFAGQQSTCSETNAKGCSSGESVRFEALNYFYVVGSCDNFSWNFGDGSPVSTERTPSHVFSGSQTTYTVRLTVSNSAGQYTYSRNVTFANSAPTKPVPTISYTVFPSTGKKGQAVTFTATSSLPTTTGWSWNFGDGTAANISQAGETKQTSSITYTFTKTGTFTVRATARNSEDVSTAPTNTAQAQIVVSDPPAIPEYKFLIPDAAYLVTGDGSWRTDVQIYTSDPQVGAGTPLEMIVTFKGQNYPLNQSKTTHIYENFISGLVSRQDRGPVIITTKNTTKPPQIWTRTYIQTANGTFGQFIPAIRIDNLGGASAVDETLYYMSGLRQNSRYRTNVGFLNPNMTSMTATVSVYDASKFKIGEFQLTLEPFQLLPFLLQSRVPNLPTDQPFSVKIDVPTGMWIVAYASYIDGLSQDAVYVQAVPESAVASPDFKTTVLPGVGHTGQWRSDVTIFNPDADGVMFDIEYYNANGEKKGSAQNVPLDSGKFLEYGDILKQGVLGNVEDGVGTLKVTVKDNHEKYPMTFARTYFDNGANGTYGQGIGGFSPARANVKPNQHAIIAGVRNSAAYRTNIGLVNVSNAPVTATVTLLDPNTGAAVAAIPYTLQPNQTIVGNFNGWGALEQGTFKIEANGAIWAFCSIIDQFTKDPEYVPATPILAQ